MASDNNENESFAVRSVKYIESNLFDIFKTLEGIFLFGLGITLTPSLQSLQIIIQREDIPLSTVFYNKSFYILFILIPLYILFIFKSKQKRDSEIRKLGKLNSDNDELKSKLKEKDNDIDEVNKYLNEAQEAIHENIIIELLKYNHSLLEKTMVNEDKL